jgi:hypothetical protein
MRSGRIESRMWRAFPIPKDNGGEGIYTWDDIDQDTMIVKRY